jgi:predicted CXXCH cytochrome family protein
MITNQTFWLFFAFSVLSTMGAYGSDIDNNIAHMPVEQPITANYIGAESCAGCHRKQFNDWSISHHAAAMQTANPKSVLGNFNDARFEHYGQITEFTQRQGRYYVRTENKQGEPEIFEVAYTFGTYPLQQYLLPTGKGHYQALTVAWDSRPIDVGGQRWFHLYPDEEIPHTDQLHWTGTYFNWNSRCASCHSTNLDKGYNDVDQSYNTKWSEINVACEACHGPAKQHQTWAQTGENPATTNLGFENRIAATTSWSFKANHATALPSKSVNSSNEPKSGSLGAQIDSCGGCHSRRRVIGAENQGQAYHQTYQLSLPTPPLYFADGQVREEDYVLGSFLQSKMFHQGVVCSNCHEPHSLELRAKGNAVCTSCHKAEVFDKTEHHHHSPSSTGAECVNCHMPETTYMVVDPRRDHSIRVPRPDLSVKYNTPNACSTCHETEGPKWAADAISKWQESSLLENGKTPHFSTLLTQGYDGDIYSLTILATNQKLPGQTIYHPFATIAQAASLSLLQNHPNNESLNTARSQLNATDPLVRRAAVDAMAMATPEQRIKDIWHLHTDPVKLVRMSVAEQLMEISPNELTRQQQTTLKPLLDEYLNALQIQSDMPSAQLNIARFYRTQRQYKLAEKSYRRAINLDRFFIPAWLNMADFYREINRDNEVEALLKEALSVNSSDSVSAIDRGNLQHALGLLLVREKRYIESLKPLEAAAKLAPSNWRHGYIFAIALDSLGKRKDAIGALESTVQANPGQLQPLTTIIDFLATDEEWKRARHYAKKLQTLDPENQQWQVWVSFLSFKVESNN